MTRCEKISERLPHFYQLWDAGSSIAQLVASSGNCIDEAEKDLVSIARAHWVDTSRGDDLERLGALFNVKRDPKESDSEYRTRLKSSIVSYKGGGTVGAISAVIRMAMKLPPDQPLEIVENPAIDLTMTWQVKAGQKWSVNSRSIYEAIPKITIKVATDGGRITNPTLENQNTGESIAYLGELSHGDELKLVDGRAYQNGLDQSEKLSSSKIPSLTRGESHWKFGEYLGENQGVFDSSQFDRAVFVVDVISSVSFQWTAAEPATFEVLLSRELLDWAGVSAEYIQKIVDISKACGVKGVVKVIYETRAL